MNQHDQNKFKMYMQVIDTCAASAADWNGLPAFANAFSALQLKVQELDAVVLQQSQKLKGVKAVKDDIRLTTALKTESMAGALKAYAESTHDLALKAQLKFPSSLLRSGGSLKNLQCIDAVLIAANAHLPALTGFGIVQQDIDELTALRADLETHFGSTRQAIVGRKQITASIDELIRGIDVLLRDSLDKLALVLRTDHKHFFVRYQAARIIVDYKGKSNKGGGEGARGTDGPGE